jgi:hypothetical protein
MVYSCFVEWGIISLDVAISFGVCLDAYFAAVTTVSIFMNKSIPGWYASLEKAAVNSHKSLEILDYSIVQPD